MSPLVSTFIDSDQAGLEDSDAGLRVTHAHFCPTLLRFVLPGQQLPGGGLHVTSPPKPAPQRTPWPQGEAWLRAHPRAVARDTPPAADARRRGNPEVPSRVERERCAGDATRHTPASNSVGSLPPIDGGGTTCGTIGTGSEPFSPSPECGRPGWVYFGEQARVNTGECLRTAPIRSCELRAWLPRVLLPPEECCIQFFRRKAQVCSRKMDKKWTNRPARRFAAPLSCCWSWWS